MCSPVHEQVMREQSGRLEQLVVTLIAVVTVAAIAIVIAIVSLDASDGWALVARTIAFAALAGAVVWTGRRFDRLNVE
jgi:hypothetical protein